jgi:hypothetical protein
VADKKSVKSQPHDIGILSLALLEDERGRFEDILFGDPSATLNDKAFD